MLTLREPIRRVLISAAAFRRPEELAKLLDSLERSIASHRESSSHPVEVDVVVTDNDKLESSRAVVAAASGPVRYQVERTAGIAAARNAGLGLFDEYDALITVDDDEVVEEGWLTALLDLAASTNADVVTGPVVSVFPETTPAWVRRGGYLQRRRRPTGTVLTRAATGNTLIRHDEWVRQGRPMFDERFSFTGGSDTDFFTRFVSGGATILWCDEAVVSEPVPADRLTRAWLDRRTMRTGYIAARIRRRTQHDVVVWLRALAHLVVAGPLYVLCRAFVPKYEWLWHNVFYSARGALLELSGREFEEYARH